MLARELKAGDRFVYEGDLYESTGYVDSQGDSIVLDENGLGDWIPSEVEVQLLPPLPEGYVLLGDNDTLPKGSKRVTEGSRVWWPTDAHFTGTVSKYRKVNSGIKFAAFAAPKAAIVPGIPPLPEGYVLLGDDDLIPPGSKRIDGCDRPDDRVWLRVNDSFHGMSLRDYKVRHHALDILAVAAPEIPPVPEGYELLGDDDVMDGSELRVDGIDSRPRSWLPGNSSGKGKTVAKFKAEFPSIKVLAVCHKIAPTYSQRQDDWIAKNGIKVGDKVRVTRKASSKEDGWSNSWVSPMDSAVGTTPTITCINDKGGLNLSTGYHFPYFVLEKVPSISDDKLRSLVGRTLLHTGSKRTVLVLGYDAVEPAICVKCTPSLSPWFDAERVASEFTWPDGAPIN